MVEADQQESRGGGQAHPGVVFRKGGNTEIGRLASQSARSAETKVVSLGNAFVRSVTLLIEVTDLDKRELEPKR